MLKADAVFEGGGVKGVGLVGAVVEAENRGYQWVNLAGTSAGAILASLLAAGYSGREIWYILRDTDFKKFCDRGFWGYIPVIGPALSLLFTQGLYAGDFFERWLHDLLAARGVYTFGDLVLGEFADDPRYRYRLQVVAADLTHGRLVVLPQDASFYGYDPDRLPVAGAVRMSMSIPFFFRPVVIKTISGVKVTIVDGGVLSNFPVWLFDTPGIPPWPTFGFKIVEPDAGQPRRIRGPVSLLAALIATMMEAHDARYIEDADFVRTIAVPSLGINAIDFNISKADSRRLFDAGRAAAGEFFDTWNFQRYVEVFRSVRATQRPQSRGRYLRSL